MEQVIQRIQDEVDESLAKAEEVGLRLKTEAEEGLAVIEKTINKEKQRVGQQILQKSNVHPNT